MIVNERIYLNKKSKIITEVAIVIVISHIDPLEKASKSSNGSKATPIILFIKKTIKLYVEAGSFALNTHPVN